METGGMEWIGPIGEFINRVGFPVAVAVILAVGVWSVIRWLRPWGEKLFQAHLDFTKSLAQTQQEQAKTQTDSFELLSSLHVMHRGNRKALGHIAEAIHEATPEEKKRDISRHIQAVREALTDP